MDDLVIYTVDPGLTFLDQFWSKAAIPVTRDVDGNSPIIAHQHLARGPIAAIQPAGWQARHAVHSPDVR